MPEPKMILFDCDGVLVDSERLTNQVIRDNLASYGLDLPLDKIISLFVGGTMAGVMQKARELGADLPDKWLDEIYPLMNDHLAQNVQPVKGAHQLLDALDDMGIPYALCSNGPHSKMAITLPKCDLQHRFKGRIYSREDVARPKPAPDLYLKAASDAGIAAEQCIVVEDSPSGARAGKAAGMFTVGYVADTEPDTLRDICDALIDNLMELTKLL